MKTKWHIRTACCITLLFTALLVAPVHAAPRILIVGDSWAQSVWVAGVMDQALARAGFEDVTSVGESCALGGTRADQWVTPAYQDKIRDALEAHSTVDMVHLIIGGNDVLRRIKEQNVFEVWTAEQRRREWDGIARNIKRIVTHCLAFEQVRHVVLAGYDYLNPATASEVYALLGQTFHFGGMTQEQVNQCFIEHEKSKRDIGLALDNCTYVHNLGLAQYHFNEPPDARRPGGPPDYEPFPGGDPRRPMPDAAFMTVHFAGRDYPGDGIHPNEEAHLVMLDNAVATVYKPLLERSAAYQTILAE